jgi:hypothetical protein
MEPLTLTQIGTLLVQAAKQVPPSQRASFPDLLKMLKTPVVGLRK